MAFDFAGEYKIAGDAAAKLKTGVAASIELNQLNASIDGELKAACGGLATDLGGAAGKDGTESCTIAVKAMNDFKAKLGGQAKIELVVKPPMCAARMDVMADCAGKCDVKATGGKAKVECEPGRLSGGCDAKCEGRCDVKSPVKCEGTCEGTCDATVKGSCSGTCDGKCDGKNAKGACAGTCEGKCEGGSVKGTCAGKCGGSCQLSAPATCDGTCTGKCSAEFKEPKCTGEITPPQVSAECKAHCDGQVTAKLDCQPAQVGVVITGAADAKLAERYKGALEKNLPGVFKIAIAMPERLVKVSANGKAVAEGVQSSFEAVAKTSSDKAHAALLVTNLTACFGGPIKAAIAAAGSLKGKVDVSISVKASASASAGGSAGTGPKAVQ